MLGGMATVTITIPDAVVPRVAKAMRAFHPELVALSDAAAFKALIAAVVRDMVGNYEAEAGLAAQAAQTAADMAGIG